VYSSSKSSILLSSMAEWYKKLPNWLTFLRLALIPVFVVFLVEPTRSALNIAAVIFVFAAITDYADGILARRYAAITDFGKLFDPLADKILVMAALVMLVSVRDERCISFVPGWMVVLILAREFWVTGLRAFAAKDGNVVAAKSGGKVKSFLQMVSILAVLLHDYTFTVFGVTVTYQFLGLNLLLVSLAFSYISAFDYSVTILAPGRGSFADCMKQLGGVVLGDSEAKKVTAKEVMAQQVEGEQVALSDRQPQQSGGAEAGDEGAVKDPE
jgi:CDP-diacylglycerol--glycerol-3-phosphate 3-phosphatidyltransferase